MQCLSKQGQGSSKPADYQNQTGLISQFEQFSESSVRFILNVEPLNY
jgi:hypothetical protein